MTSTHTTKNRGAYSRTRFVAESKNIHGIHFQFDKVYAALPTVLRGPVALKCRFHGTFDVLPADHLSQTISGGCPKCADREGLTAEQVLELCDDGLPTQGDPWNEEVHAPFPEWPAYAVSSQWGKVYNRILRRKRGRTEYVHFEEKSDSHYAGEIDGIECQLGWLVIATFRPIMYQEGYWIRFKDRNPTNVDLANLNWVEKEDLMQRFWDEMYEEDLEWDHGNDSED